MVEFVSQRSTVHWDTGCGVAALLMLLKTASIPTPKTFKEMGRLLQVNIVPKIKWGHKFSDYGLGAYTRDVVKYLEDNRINYIAIADTGKSSISWSVLVGIIGEVPTMVGMRDENNPEEWGEGGHWVVLEKTSDEFFKCYDPYRKKSEKYVYKIGVNKLKTDWDGYAIAIT
ncbi:MAG: hypothetical protein KKI12_00145 [Proteobacteria bacterium]|nr:hypothetical protein [Pseudomonadota bacterium]MCG2757358.1 hypothetical protein [Desulfobacteraceae bacterium]